MSHHVELIHQVLNREDKSSLSDEEILYAVKNSIFLMSQVYKYYADIRESWIRKIRVARSKRRWRRSPHWRARR